MALREMATVGAVVSAWVVLKAMLTWLLASCTAPLVPVP